MTNYDEFMFVTDSDTYVYNNFLGEEFQDEMYLDNVSDLFLREFSNKRKKCKLFRLKDINSKTLINKMLSYANHGDIIFGTNIVYDKIRIVYKQDGIEKLINPLSGHVKVYNKIPIEISKYIKKPIKFYSIFTDYDLACEYNNYPFISEIELDINIHKKLIYKYYEKIDDKYNYMLGFEIGKYLYKINKNNEYDIESVDLN